jgi:hypothetical protein
VKCHGSTNRKEGSVEEVSGLKRLPEEVNRIQAGEIGKRAAGNIMGYLREL